MYLVKTPPIVKTIFSDYIWSLPTNSSEVFLTFDDGPVPEVTPWVLDLLKEYGFTATFFCVGENVKKYPEIYNRILNEGHNTGNHTFSHLNGWMTETETYINNIAMCDRLVDSRLFRPPYGKMRPKQAVQIKKNSTIVMWDVLSGDFDKHITPEQCLENVMKNYEVGSVIVFHDSIKALQNLKYVLPRFFKHLEQQGIIASQISTEELELA